MPRVHMDVVEFNKQLSVYRRSEQYNIVPYISASNEIYLTMKATYLHHTLDEVPKPSGSNVTYGGSRWNAAASRGRMDTSALRRAEEFHVEISAVRVDSDDKHNNKVSSPAPTLRSIVSWDANTFVFAVNRAPGIRIIDGPYSQEILDHAHEQLYEPRGYAQYHISISVCHENALNRYVTDFLCIVAWIPDNREKYQG